MSTIVEVTLPWGRMQATPWNRTPNEGAVEWPPSPWRLLRALYASWKTHEPDTPADEVGALLTELAVPPSFVVPPHTESHTRHYFPGIAHRAGESTDTAKVINAAVVTEREARLWIEWAVDLSPAQLELLSRLVSGVRYLGRAESIVDLELVERCGEGERLDPHGSVAGRSVRLLTPETPLDIGALIATPSQVRKERRLLPPSTRWTLYSCPEPARPTTRRARRREERVNAVRFEIHSNVLPSRFESVTLADVAHRAVVARADGGSEVLSGRDAAGHPLRGLHRHAHFLSVPERLDETGRKISGLVVWAPAGLADDDLRAVRGLRTLKSWRLDESGVARLVVVADGGPDDVVPELARPSSVWESVTPYVMTRHHKGELVDRLAADVRRELAHRLIDVDVDDVEVVPGSWLKYRRYRQGRERIRDQRAAFGLRLRLGRPVAGPLALGQLSHFGLGLFRPIDV